MAKLKAADFFAGAGLASLGLKGGFDVVWANDVCPKKQWVYEANHGSDHFHLDDIRNVGGKDLPPVDIHWASFPCQDISLAGNKTGLSGRRSGLYWEWVRVLDELENKPAVVCLENVTGLITSNGGADYIELHKSLVDRGYVVGAMVLDAARWLPQSRPRVFVVASHLQPEGLSQFIGKPQGWMHPNSVIRLAEKCQSWVWWNLPEPESEHQQLDALIEWDVESDVHSITVAMLQKELSEVQKRKLANALIDGIRVMTAYRRTRHGRPMMEIRFDGVAGCLRTPNGGSSRQRLLLRKDGLFLESRLITAREAARLMGAPEYVLPTNYNDAYRAMGDAVVVPVVEHLANSLLAPLARRARYEEASRRTFTSAA